ncbi:hypothetical protein TRFO_25268 [Tritrichomonas foetus]|uniref:Chromo domain-containing protein n=1 Tax=Tritrichomonas foetus TaxID=1144522 RepID=A0A1J4KB14_9EUKA|nr:hypothetical protein TRFO_25268 [Tritrichomonas foetus]|eukprot:OHT06653.1 hypothetical protein TRFO_25268 [Tritrichomonas foetus]
MSESEEYEIESICGFQIIQGKKKYFIKWKNYDEEGNTWEFEENLKCPELIEKYNEEHADEVKEIIAQAEAASKRKAGPKSKCPPKSNESPTDTAKPNKVTDQNKKEIPKIDEDEFNKEAELEEEEINEPQSEDADEEIDSKPKRKIGRARKDAKPKSDKKPKTKTKKTPKPKPQKALGKITGMFKYHNRIYYEYESPGGKRQELLSVSINPNIVINFLESKISE